MATEKGWSDDNENAIKQEVINIIWRGNLALLEINYSIRKYFRNGIERNESQIEKLRKKLQNDSSDTAEEFLDSDSFYNSSDSVDDCIQQEYSIESNVGACNTAVRFPVKQHSLTDVVTVDDKETVDRSSCSHASLSEVPRVVTSLDCTSQNDSVPHEEQNESHISDNLQRTSAQIENEKKKSFKSAEKESEGNKLTHTLNVTEAETAIISNETGNAVLHFTLNENSSKETPTREDQEAFDSSSNSFPISSEVTKSFDIHDRTSKHNDQILQNASLPYVGQKQTGISGSFQHTCKTSENKSESSIKSDKNEENKSIDIPNVTDNEAEVDYPVSHLHKSGSVEGLLGSDETSSRFSTSDRTNRKGRQDISNLVKVANRRKSKKQRSFDEIAKPNLRQLEQNRFASCFVQMKASKAEDETDNESSLKVHTLGGHIEPSTSDKALFGRNVLASNFFISLETDYDSLKLHQSTEINKTMHAYVFAQKDKLPKVSIDDIDLRSYCLYLHEFDNVKTSNFSNTNGIESHEKRDDIIQRWCSLNPSELLIQLAEILDITSKEESEKIFKNLEYHFIQLEHTKSKFAETLPSVVFQTMFDKCTLKLHNDKDEIENEVCFLEYIRRQHYIKSLFGIKDTDNKSESDANLEKLKTALMIDPLDEFFQSNMIRCISNYQRLGESGKECEEILDLCSTYPQAHKVTLNITQSIEDTMVQKDLISRTNLAEIQDFEPGMLSLTQADQVPGKRPSFSLQKKIYARFEDLYGLSTKNMGFDLSLYATNRMLFGKDVPCDLLKKGENKINSFMDLVTFLSASIELQDSFEVDGTDEKKGKAASLKFLLGFEFVLYGNSYHLLFKRYKTIINGQSESKYRLIVVPAEVFENAMRQWQIEHYDVTFTNYFPKTCRMFLGIPVYKGGFINRRDEKDRRIN